MALGLEPSHGATVQDSQPPPPRHVMAGWAQGGRIKLKMDEFLSKVTDCREQGDAGGQRRTKCKEDLDIFKKC